MFNKVINRGNAGQRLVQFFKEEFPSHAISIKEAVKLVENYENEFYTMMCQPLQNSGNPITLFAFTLYKISVDKNSLPKDVRDGVKVLFDDFINYIDLHLIKEGKPQFVVGGVNVNHHDFAVLKRIQYQ